MCVYYEIVLFQYISDRELRKNIFCITTVLYLVKTIDRHFVDDVENAPYAYANVVSLLIDWLTSKESLAVERDWIVVVWLQLENCGRKILYVV